MTRTEEKDYGELLHETILNILGDELTYNELKFYSNDKEDYSSLKTKTIIFKDEIMLFMVYINNDLVLEKKYSIHHSCDMFYLLGELELEQEED